MVDNYKQGGFALLLSLIVVGVVLSVGVFLLDSSIKQVRLAGNARDSEAAFHAANAGIECASYTRRSLSATMEMGGTVSPSCFGVSAGSTAAAILINNSNGKVYQYQYQFTWDSGGRCTKVNTILMVTTADGSGLTLSNVRTYIPGFPDQPGATANTKSCVAGGTCTILSVRGYNRPCATATGDGAVEREALLQY